MRLIPTHDHTSVNPVAPPTIVDSTIRPTTTGRLILVSNIGGAQADHRDAADAARRPAVVASHVRSTMLRRGILASIGGAQSDHLDAAESAHRPTVVSTASRSTTFGRLILVDIGDAQADHRDAAQAVQAGPAGER